MNTRRLHSVGIDVGTTTTQVIFSALEVTNRAPVNQVPRYEFSSREILSRRARRRFFRRCSINSSSGLCSTM